MAETPTATPATPGRPRPPYPNENPPAPLPRPPAQGGSGAPIDLPTAVEQEYAAQGKKDTGADYRREVTKFISWLQAHGLTLATMPPDAADRYCKESFRSPPTHNKVAAALKAAFDLAPRHGIQVAPQNKVERLKPQPKTVPVPGPASGAPMNQPTHVLTPAAPGASPGVAPAVMATATPTPPPPGTQAAPLPPSQAVVDAQVSAPRPVAAPKPQTGPAIPSMGQRIRVTKVATAEDTRRGWIPGNEVGIGDYQRSVFEADGDTMGFILRYLRPAYGHGTYRFHWLDTSARPLQGQSFEHYVLPDPVETMNGQHNGQLQGYGQPMQPNGFGQPHVVPSIGYPQPQAPAPMPGAPNPFEMMQKLTDRVEQQLKEEKAQYEAKRKELEEKAAKTGMDPTMLTILLNQIPQPRPPDMAELRRQLREELTASQPPAPLPAPTPTVPNFFDQQPRTDPAMERLAASMEKMMEWQMQMLMKQMSQPATPPPDPIAQMTAFANALKAMQPPPPPPPTRDPVHDQLITAALGNLTAPKSNGLEDALKTWQLLENVKNSAGPSGPSFIEAISEAIQTVAENGDKLGQLFANVRGIPQGLIKPNAPVAPPQLPATAPAAKPAAPVPVQLTPEIKATFEAMIQTPDTTPEDPQGTAYDERLLNNMLEFFKALHSAKTPDGKPIEYWANMLKALIARFKAVDTRAELRVLVTQLFGWVGAKEFLKRPEIGEKFVERLVSALHSNYSAVYALMPKEKGDAPQKTLADAPTTAAPVPVEGGSKEEGDDEGDEDEDGEDDEDEEVEEAAKKSA